MAKKKGLEKILEQQRLEREQEYHRALMEKYPEDSPIGEKKRTKEVVDLEPAQNMLGSQLAQETLDVAKATEQQPESKTDEIAELKKGFDEIDKTLSDKLEDLQKQLGENLKKTQEQSLKETVQIIEKQLGTTDPGLLKEIKERLEKSESVSDIKSVLASSETTNTDSLSERSLEYIKAVHDKIPERQEAEVQAKTISEINEKTPDKKEQQKTQKTVEKLEKKTPEPKQTKEDTDALKQIRKAVEEQTLLAKKKERETEALTKYAESVKTFKTIGESFKDFKTFTKKNFGSFDKTMLSLFAPRGGMIDKIGGFSRREGERAFIKQQRMLGVEKETRTDEQLRKDFARTQTYAKGVKRNEQRLAEMVQESGLSALPKEVAEKRLAETNPEAKKLLRQRERYAARIKRTDKAAEITADYETGKLDKARERRERTPSTREAWGAVASERAGELSSVAQPTADKEVVSVAPASSPMVSAGESAQVTIVAKNTMSLGGIARDLNVARQNLQQLVKLGGGEAKTGADAHMLKESERSEKYDVQLEKEKTILSEKGTTVASPLTKEGAEESTKFQDDQLNLLRQIEENTRGTVQKGEGKKQKKSAEAAGEKEGGGGIMDTLSSAWDVAKTAGGSLLKGAGSVASTAGKALGSVARFAGTGVGGAVLGGLGGAISSGIGAYGDYTAAQEAADRGEITKDEASERKYGAVGKGIGGTAGGAIGGALGSALGPLGTMAGAWLGNKAGEFLGEWGGKGINKLAGAAGSAWEGVKGMFGGVDKETPAGEVPKKSEGMLSKLGKAASMAIPGVGLGVAAYKGAKSLFSTAEDTYNRGTSGTDAAQNMNAEVKKRMAAAGVQPFTPEANKIREEVRADIVKKDPDAFRMSDSLVKTTAEHTTSEDSKGTAVSKFSEGTSSEKSVLGSSFLGSLMSKKGLTIGSFGGNTETSTVKDGESSAKISDIIGQRTAGGLFSSDKYQVRGGADDKMSDVSKSQYMKIQELTAAGKTEEAQKVLEDAKAENAEPFWKRAAKGVGSALWKTSLPGMAVGGATALLGEERVGKISESISSAGSSLLSGAGKALDAVGEYTPRALAKKGGAAISDMLFGSSGDRASISPAARTTGTDVERTTTEVESAKQPKAASAPVVVSAPTTNVSNTTVRSSGGMGPIRSDDSTLERYVGSRWVT